MAHVTKSDIEMFAARVTKDFVASGVPLNDSIAKIAVDNGLNREQVRRIVQSANVLANTALVKQARASKADPRIHFKMASDEAVFSKMHGHHPMAKVAFENKREKFVEMFAVPSREPMLSKTARHEPFEPVAKMSTVTPADLAAAYMGANRESIDPDALITPGLVNMALVDLDNIDNMSTDHVSGARNRIEAAESALRRCVSDEIRSGLEPSIIKQAMAQYPACKESTVRAFEIVDEQAQELGATQKLAAIEIGDFVDPRHPVIGHMHKIGSEMRELVKAQAVQKRVRAAKAAAGRDAKAVKATGTCKTAMLAGLTAAARAAPSVARMAASYGPMAGSVASHFVPALGRTAAFQRGMPMLRAASRGMQAANLVGKGIEAGKSFGPGRTPAVGPVKVASFGEGVSLGLLNAPNFSTFAGALLATAAVTTGARLIDKGLSRVGQGISATYDKQRNKKMFAELAKENPSFASNPRAAQYFDLVMEYAPSLGKNKMATADYIHRLLEFPRSSVELVKSLVDLEKVYRDTVSGRSSPPGPTERGIATLPKLPRRDGTGNP